LLIFLFFERIASPGNGTHTALSKKITKNPQTVPNRKNTIKTLIEFVEPLSKLFRVRESAFFHLEHSQKKKRTDEAESE
jgi:hypothetical protein